MEKKIELKQITLDGQLYTLHSDVDKHYTLKTEVKIDNTVLKENLKKLNDSTFLYMISDVAYERLKREWFSNDELLGERSYQEQEYAYLSQLVTVYNMGKSL